MVEELKIKIDKGEELDELRLEIIDVLNKHSNTINGYEMIGVLDVVRNDVHVSIQEKDDG